MQKRKTRTGLAALLLCGVLAYTLTAPGGSLEPSAPPGPTMKTLDEVEPRVPIHAADLPLTITEPNSYYFAEDIDFDPNDTNAITIECNDVTIDLAGYSLIGPDSGENCGIVINGRSNVEIRNGTIRDFNYPAIVEVSSGGSGHRIINIRALSNRYGIILSGYGHLVKDCTAAENDVYGIYAAKGSTVTGNTVYDNGDSATSDVYGIGVGDGSTVAGNTVYDNGDSATSDVYGIRAGAGCTVTGNTVHDSNGTGIEAGSGSTVTGNTVYDNGDDGIFAGYWSTVSGNTAHSNSGDGIRVYHDCLVTNNACASNGDDGDGAGIHAHSNRNRIEGNNVTHNDRGIDVDESGNLIVKNSASNNTTNYDIVVGNKVGTISTDPTTAGPWDNFEF